MLFQVLASACPGTCHFLFNFSTYPLSTVPLFNFSTFPGIPSSCVLIASFAQSAAGSDECTIVPWLITCTWSATFTAKAAFCSTSRTDVPSSLQPANQARHLRDHRRRQALGRLVHDQQDADWRRARAQSRASAARRRSARCPDAGCARPAAETPRRPSARPSARRRERRAAPRSPGSLAPSATRRSGGPAEPGSMPIADRSGAAAAA